MIENVVGRLSPNVHPTSAVEDNRPTTFIVRRAPGGYALQFVKNLCGRHVVDVAEAEAQPFDTRWEAELKAKEFGLTERDFHVEQIPTTQPEGK